MLTTIEEFNVHDGAFIYGSIDRPPSERESYRSYHVSPSSVPSEDSIDEYNSNHRYTQIGRALGVAFGAALTLLALWGRDKSAHGGRTHSLALSSLPQFDILGQVVPTSVQGRAIRRPPFRGSERYYVEQLVDHFASSDDNSGKGKTYSQKYFFSAQYFAGPGHPIFLICGGEADAMIGFYYPFVAHELASKFGAYVMQIEHRFYGKSQPLGIGKGWDDTQRLSELLTPDQAIADFVQLSNHIRKDELGCSMDQSSAKYCPLIAVGGSYAARLATMMRLAYPEAVDIAYAASSPLLGFVGYLNPHAYYDHISEVADKISPGCSRAVKSTLLHVNAMLKVKPKHATFKDKATSIGVCPNTLPEYMTKNSEVFAQEIMMLIANIFAEYNMDFYPPTMDAEFARACILFQDAAAFKLSLTPREKLSLFFRRYAKLGGYRGKHGCFDLSTQVPSGGKHPTISTADWSGAGGGNDGNIWDFQACNDLTTPVGFSRECMFPQREWGMDWIRDHCWERFGIVPQPHRLMAKYGFDDLVGQGASRILFTNGLNDGWSACGSVMHDLSPSILALNFPNATHHSDLTYKGPPNQATKDIQKGRIKIATILGTWLDEMKNDAVTS